MHYMHDLKDLLCAELEDYAEKGKKSGKMSMGDLESIHKLTDTVKNIMKIGVLEQEMDGGYSERGGSSYARGRGRYAKRDSMGRYSRDGGMSYDDDMSYARSRGYRGGYSRDEGKSYMMDRLGELMDEASTPTEREALKKCMQALERA